ncbi:LysM peptidoglycan-binding domain-containing protein [Flavobacterium restrictum]|uniref:LysM peptidoglycan-binding domain-containing protein n=1 Tax=Flavobacterium restrictum TaxID=2594428 RepID=A0A553E436_9FLAO|nr:LysM peptidoglycan-binding domain-containing protein [Flavobacterium restrictum]TRX39765.1 LysM peptidoglycan-binding domain-containing protein [Flavobacterium restrictum]
MKYFITVFLASLVFTLSSFMQVKSITHKVAKGETINQIAQQYKVTPYSIYQLNPDAQSGLKPNSILLIPTISGEKKVVIPAVTKTNSKIKTHEVAPKETLFAIEKQYNVSDEELKKANTFLEKSGLQIGQVLVIPSAVVSKTTTAKPVAKTETPIYHEVLPKETKYSIAKQYNMTIAELEQKNPEIVPNLPIGYPLLIKGTAPKKIKVVEVEPKKELVVQTTHDTYKPHTDYVNYEVKPKETLYSLSKMTGLSAEELLVLNPSLVNGVQDGMVLKVPVTGAVVSQETKKVTTILAPKSTSDRKKLVLLLPFNISKIEGDTINTTVDRLKKDKFLNMTLDFYSGALMAIDSAKQIGLAVDVSIFDSQETKNNSNCANLIQLNNLATANAIIGPFYQSNVEKTASLLAQSGVAVISPLSKDIGNSYPNLYQSITTAATIKNAMFDYMKSKNGNIIAVVDKKKESSRLYLQQNQKEVQLAPLTETGGLNAEGLKQLFVKNQMNYVILETGNTGTIKATMATMLAAMGLYKVQLVILEPNETLDTDEISFPNLVKLKLMYPTMTRENSSVEAQIFEKEYKKKNKVLPSTFANRGFDVTFDTLMRLSQDQTFQETVDTTATEQINNKFEYYKKEDGGYTNKGVYIVYYDTDLKVHEAE